jgi:hypothetical protein
MNESKDKVNSLQAPLRPAIVSWLRTVALGLSAGSMGTSIRELA